jgi:hypothetical protein
VLVDPVVDEDAMKDWSPRAYGRIQRGDMKPLADETTRNAGSIDGRIAING